MWAALRQARQPPGAGRLRAVCFTSTPTAAEAAPQQQQQAYPLAAAPVSAQGGLGAEVRESEPTALSAVRPAAASPLLRSGPADHSATALGSHIAARHCAPPSFSPVPSAAQRPITRHPLYTLRAPRCAGDLALGTDSGPGRGWLLQQRGGGGGMAAPQRAAQARRRAAAASVPTGRPGGRPGYRQAPPHSVRGPGAQPTEAGSADPPP